MSGTDLEVSGGAGGTSARYADLEVLAWRSEADSDDFLVIAAKAHGLLVDDDVLASAVLDPIGMVRLAETLLGALDGPQGLTALALRLRARGLALRTAAASYRAVDSAQRDLIDGIRFAAGYALGANPAAAALLAAVGVGGVALADKAGLDWQRLLTEHPGVVDNLIGAAPGLIDGLPGPDPVAGVSSAARLLGLLYPDGTATVRDLGVDDTVPAMVTAPRGFADLLEGLEHRDANSLGDQQGDIDVRAITAADGSRSYIVDIPGTRDWHPAPGQHDGPLNDLGTDLHAMGGQSTAYEQGIGEALRRAGAGPRDPVLLVGHSQGGLVAVDAANHFVSSGQFNVTHVVTVGAPVGRLDLPESVNMLSLENRNDVVTHLDGADNPDTPHRTTVSFSADAGTVEANHDIATAYLPAARALDASMDPSVAAFRHSGGAFLEVAGGRVTSTVYQIRRE